MKWPVGRYNGRRIVGLELELKFRVNVWYWRPRWVRYSNRVAWLCFIVAINCAYD
jgi:hypothetical protein